MKTPDEIKRGLDECTRLGGCAACPYFDMGPTARCAPKLAADAIAYIRELEVEKYRLATECQKLREERDRYWQYIKGLGCDTCGGDCDRCEVTLDRVWTGWKWNGNKEE